MADKEGTFRFYIPSYRNFEFDGLASFDVDSARDWLSPRFIHNFDPSLVSVKALDGFTKRLDDLDLEPALIKVDVQGFETQVLQGAAQTIERHRPVFIIENNDEGMSHADILSKLDYSMTGFSHSRFQVDEMGKINSVFVPREKLAELIAHFGNVSE